MKSYFKSKANKNRISPYDIEKKEAILTKLNKYGYYFQINTDDHTKFTVHGRVPDLRGKIEGEPYLIEIDEERHGYGEFESKQTKARNDAYIQHNVNWIQIIESLCNWSGIKIEDYALIRCYEEASKVRARERMIL